MRKHSRALIALRAQNDICRTIDSALLIVDSVAVAGVFDAARVTELPAHKRLSLNHQAPCGGWTKIAGMGIGRIVCLMVTGPNGRLPAHLA